MMPLRLTMTFAIVGLGVFVAAVVVGHLLYPELDVRRHQVSEYANRPAGGVVTAGFAAWAVSTVAASGAVRILRVPGDRVMAVALLLGAVGIAMTAAWPTQTVAGELPPGVGLRGPGRAHDSGSGFASLALALAALGAGAAPGAPVGQRIVALGAVSLAVVVSVVLLVAGDPMPGIRQRALVLIAVAWQTLLLAPET